MKRFILTAALIGTLAAAVAPAFATEVANCDSSVRGEWSRCVIEQSQSGQ